MNAVLTMTPERQVTLARNVCNYIVDRIAALPQEGLTDVERKNAERLTAEYGTVESIERILERKYRAYVNKGNHVLIAGAVDVLAEFFCYNDRNYEDARTLEGILYKDIGMVRDESLFYANTWLSGAKDI